MPTAKPRLGIIIGSTRPERMSKSIEDWVYTAANASDKFDVELIDLAEINLPFFDEPPHRPCTSTPMTTPSAGQKLLTT